MPTRKRNYSPALHKRPTTQSITQSPAKLSAAEPTTAAPNSGVNPFVQVCRRVLLIDTQTLLCVNFCLLTMISVVTDYFPCPKSYFSDKRNFVNQCFVKLGWGWTCGILGVFIYLTSSTYCCGKKRYISRHFLRLTFGTIWWFICTKLFALIQDLHGICVTDHNLTRDNCEASGNQWIPFDVSGHTFLLLHCLSIISEEAKCIGNWEHIDEIIREQSCLQSKSRFPSDDLTMMRSLYDKNTPRIRCLIIVLTLLSLMWEVMFLSTVVYFHNLSQKLAGACFATLGWLVSYRIWYKWKSWSPGLPGQGVLKYLKES